MPEACWSDRSWELCEELTLTVKFMTGTSFPWPTTCCLTGVYNKQETVYQTIFNKSGQSVQTCSFWLKRMLILQVKPASHQPEDLAIQLTTEVTYIFILIFRNMFIQSYLRHLVWYQNTSDFQQKKVGQILIIWETASKINLTGLRCDHCWPASSFKLQASRHICLCLLGAVLWH